MQSRSKRAPSRAESDWLDLVAQTKCACCDETPTSRNEIHEVEQGNWYLSIGLCASCHRGPLLGLHGQRRMWAMRKLTEVQALAITVARVHALMRQQEKEKS